jgi:hypothetical protein
MITIIPAQTGWAASEYRLDNLVSEPGVNPSRFFWEPILAWQIRVEADGYVQVDAITPHGKMDFDAVRAPDGLFYAPHVGDFDTVERLTEAFS